jgi:hypothetical protein
MLNSCAFTFPRSLLRERHLRGKGWPYDRYLIRKYVTLNYPVSASFGDYMPKKSCAVLWNEDNLQGFPPSEYLVAVRYTQLNRLGQRLLNRMLSQTILSRSAMLYRSDE